MLTGFLLELHGRVFWVTAGHCLKDGLDDLIVRGAIRITGGGFMDYLGVGAQHFHLIPHRYEIGDAAYVELPGHGVDFGILMLDELQIKDLAANNTMPIGRENWIHQPQLTFDIYRMLGIPANRVFRHRLSESSSRLAVQPAMVAIDRITIDEAGSPPPGSETPTDAWFIGRIDPLAKIDDIKGMSGGPIYGFRKHADGRLTYHVVAVQSRWWPHSRTIFGCSLPMIAEAIWQEIDDMFNQFRESASGD